MAQTASRGVLHKKRRRLRRRIGLGLVVLLLAAASVAWVVRERALSGRIPAGTRGVRFPALRTGSPAIFTARRAMDQ